MLGLGSFQNNSRSLTQLSFGIEMSKNLGFKGKLEAYDPVFTDLDCEFLEELNIEFNLEKLDVYNAKQPVIFYMPHCPISMYETLFKMNWTLERLCNIFLIGNCLKTYDLTIQLAKKKKYPFVFKACVIFESILFSKAFERPEIFNDLAFQWCEEIVAEKFLV
ncbi:hypothetical protein T552_02973 [Pneumocystis carinii B80]|uniref:SRR1-like domain-containing protein n=1 Tax=Pneumocystis carinii (strain B80) TaxID=1408658 RepID=A0A0W4ZCD7_PNEC8|nr:hypothetical protein T552_02973 [Pneumocystis carinii B80]KTW26080.1 hypothetical protein T552_02973 [Pneumocystis carinii B80]